jgi:hypothetical protein
VRGLAIQRRLAVISKLGRPLSAAARAFSGTLRTLAEAADRSDTAARKPIKAR